MNDTFDLLIPARDRSIGAATVKRTLPSPRRRMVGPFIFSDQLGPLVHEAGQGMDVKPHPHIGLATVTLTFNGTLVHRDSTGAHQVIKPGEVNWMTAGRGVTHSERSPLPDRPAQTVELLQTWVALPTDRELAEPSFEHAGANELPSRTIDGATVTVMVGNHDGMTSPVTVASALMLVTLDLAPGASHRIADDHPQRGVLAHSGPVDVSGTTLPQWALGVTDGRGEPVVTNTSSEPVRVVLLGGQPVGPRHISWNFVSSSRQRLVEAARDWDRALFDEVPGDRDEREELPRGLRE